MCFYLATGIQAIGIPRNLTGNAPQTACHSRNVHSSLCTRFEEHNGISDDLLRQFQLMAQYAAAAYCPINNDSPSSSIVCPTGNCPLVESAGARTVIEFENTTGADVTGFLAVDETNRLIVLGIRGSHSTANWKINFNFPRGRTDLCDKCRIHRGYWKAWLGFRDTVRPQVLLLMKDYPDYRFAITGHSLGGALGTIAAGDLRKMNDDLARRTELYSFGSPRLASYHAAVFLSEQSPMSYRITNRKDPVPRLPPWIFGFGHTSPEYYITNHSANPGPDDFKVFEGYQHDRGNSGSGDFLKGYKKHASYFSPEISQCAVKKDKSSR